MTDAEWAVVRSLLPVPGWMRGRGGQPEVYCHRAVLDAIRYLVDNGIKWRGATRGRTDQVAYSRKDLIAQASVHGLSPASTCVAGNGGV
ncbi:transposase [Streptomyces sp. 7R007]